MEGAFLLILPPEGKALLSAVTLIYIEVLNYLIMCEILFVMRKFLPLLLLFVLPFMGHAQDEKAGAKKGIITFDSELTSEMANPTDNLRKVSVYLEHKKEAEMTNKGLVLGASLISIFDYQSSNTDSKFAYLMRHPTSSNEIGTSVSEFVIHSAQFSMMGDVNNWISLFTEVLYNPEQSFGPGTITALGRNQLQLRKGMVIFGDLNKFPIYGAIGKMDTPFGQTESVNPFTNSTIWHAFGGLGFGAQLSFKKAGFHATVMAIQGGAQFRVLNAPVDETNVPSRVNNFSLDANYTLHLMEQTSLRLGASYLHGTSYIQDFPVEHFNPGKENNPAVSYYTTFLLKGFELKASYATTMDVWPGTYNPNPPLDVYAASKVSSLSIGAKYNFQPSGKWQYAISGEFSNFVAGATGAPWERQNQTVLGFSATTNHTAKLFVELFSTQGYSPLNWVSGGNFADPGVTWSDRDATSFGIVVGTQVSL